MLPYCNGRSYGDSCLNDGEALIDVRGSNRLIAFDREQNSLRCEAGARFDDLINLLVREHRFLPVVPGTQFVSVGGAIANDIHGKNHHRVGSFGHHVREFELLRSDGSRFTCSPNHNADLFRATIGGLGLTGRITWAEFSVRPIPGPAIDLEAVKFDSIEEFVELSFASEKESEYTVAWIDLALGSTMGRGLFMRGDHTEGPEAPGSGSVTLPIPAPNGLIGNLASKAFNTAYYRLRPKRVRKTVSLRPFFFPLDAIHSWNKLYGTRGFLQYQCILPPELAPVLEILRLIRKSGLASSLVVGKTFGDFPPAGLMTFPRRGITLAMDFPNSGKKLFRMLDDFDRIATSVYPAKDARMSPTAFRKFFPMWQEFSRFIDPAFSSSFWRRVTQ